MTNNDPPLEKHSPKLILEPLPNGLNNAFLKDNETCPVVVPSSLAEY